MHKGRILCSRCAILTLADNAREMCSLGSGLVQTLEMMKEAGYLKGGTAGCTMVASGGSWLSGALPACAVLARLASFRICTIAIVPSG